MNKTVVDQPYIEDLENTTARPDRSGVAIWLLLFIAGVVAGCAHLFIHNPSIAVLQLGSFLLIGSLFAAFAYKRTMAAQNLSVLLYSITAVGALVLVLNAIYMYKKQPQFVSSLLFAAAFLAPSFIVEAWRQFQLIFSVQAPLWYYSSDLPPEPIFVYLENKPVRIKILGDDRNRTISSEAPLSLKLGMVFFYAMKDQHPTPDWKAQFLKPDGRPYGWQFYTTEFGFLKRFLYPDETLFENKLKSNSLIIAKRID